MSAPGADRFAGHPRLNGHVPAAGGDTHGLPWAGRRVEPAPFAGDTGAAEPAVIDALTAWASAPAQEYADREAVAVEALAASRVLVPLLAAPADDFAGAPAARRDSEADPAVPGASESGMATALLRGPDGSQGLPLFTSVTALMDWDAAARPVPMSLPQACMAALEQGCAVGVIDLGQPHAAVLRGSHLWAIAAGERWVPAHRDPVVRLAVAEAAQGVDGLLSARCEDGAGVHPPGTLRLVLALRPGLTPSAVDGLIGRIGDRLAADPDVRRRIDDLAVIVRQSGDPGDAAPPEPFL